MVCCSFQLTTHQELWAFIVTNLASVYIREGNRHQEVSCLLGSGCSFKSQNILGERERYYCAWVILFLGIFAE